MRRHSLLAGLVCLTFTVYSQDFTPATWRYIDTSILNNKNLSKIYDFVQQLREKALKEKKYLHVARCYYYQLLITDKRTEDSLYFRNSAFIDSLISTDPGNKEMQLAMHLLQANRLIAFTHRYNRFDRQRYERDELPINYASYTNAELDTMSQIHFEQVRKIAKQIPGTPVEDVLWLSSDPLVFLFKPGIVDIVMAEEINGWSKTLFNVSYDSKYAKFISLSPGDFIASMDSLYTNERNACRQFEVYKEWLEYQKKNPAAYYFIETLARKSLYEMIGRRNTSLQLSIQKDYENYLLKLTSSPYNTVKAHGIYQLCLLWNQQAKRYSPRYDFDYNYTREYSWSSDGYDTSYRYHATKALNLFDRNRSLFDSFAYLGNILRQMKQNILDKNLAISMQQHNLPGEPVLAELSFKNTEKIFYKVVRANASFSFNERPTIVNELKQLPEVFHNVLPLPAADDHNSHTTYLKLDALSPGPYSLLFSDEAITDSNQGIRWLDFEVTSIVVMNSNERVFILDRKTGFPLAGASVEARAMRDPKDTLQLKPVIKKFYTANEQGFVTIKDRKLTNLFVYYKNDTSFSSVNFYSKDVGEPGDVYNKEDYDDLVEFYEDNATAEIFTDRSIYRPGQTVYFKAIFLTRNKNTGEKMVMSKQNLGGVLFKNVYKKWQKESEPELYVKDPFSREVDTIRIKPNEYGSVSGSFKIPKTAATGDWSIETDYIDVERNDGEFRVEEYKRPSYEITMESPKKQILPGDSFTVKARVKSFAGAALNNVRINYTIERNSRLPRYDGLQKKFVEEYADEELVDTFAYTNAEGELDIPVIDSGLRKYSFTDTLQRTFFYEINAGAIDATGESYETKSEVRVSSQPIGIRLSIPDKNNRADKTALAVITTDVNAGKVQKDVKIKIYRVIREEKLYNDRKLIAADQWLYSKEQLQQWFPLINFNGKEAEVSTKLVMERTLQGATDEKLELDSSLFTAGIYKIVAMCEVNGVLRGKSSKTFSVFDETENTLPEQTWSFHQLPFNSFSAGDTVQYKSGNSETAIYSIYHLQYYKRNKNTGINEYYATVRQEKGINRWKWKVPADAANEALLTQVFVLNNQVFTSEERIYFNSNKVEEPEIIIEQYRKKLSPGSKETFVVSIKTKDENTAAELMTTLYDASLDKLEEHRWEKPGDRSRRGYLESGWDRYINYNTRNKNQEDYLYDEVGGTNLYRTQPLWWVNPLDLDYYDDRPAYYRGGFNPGASGLFGMRVGSGDGYATRLLEGRASGISISNTQGLNEVVVVGYGVARRADLTGSVSTVRIRGASLTSYNQSFVILDGVPYQGDLSKLDASTITQGLLLKGADAVAIYGSRAAQGVLVLSTKGDIIFPAQPPEPPLPVRKNFNETAFFFPAIYADKNGYFNFSFTMPETVTEWNWKLLAHTKKAQFAYAERKLNTQLPLMVQPNMPRLLYQGDRIVLQSRISNLDSADANGKASCKIEDLVTGEDVTSSFLAKTENNFSVGKKANISSAFEINVPKTQLNPVKITVSVRSTNFADGEEHIIPILSPKILVRDNQPFRFSKNSDTTLAAINLPAGAELYGIGLSILPKPQSALVNSLPYLANYSFDCAEQTFNKLLAHLIAFKMMRTDVEVQKSFDKARQAVEKQPDLPDQLNEQATPWLSLSNRTVRQQRQLFELLDTSRAKDQVEKHLEKLYKLQNGDGGLTWFDGGRSNLYISNYVLAGFGRLKKDSLELPKTLAGARYEEFIRKLVSYCKAGLSSQVDDRFSSYDLLFSTYAFSYWKDRYPFSDSSFARILAIIRAKWKMVNKYSLSDQAILISVTLRYFDSTTNEYRIAVEQLHSIEQLAIKDASGLRWKDLADSDDMSRSAEETLALLAEAFSEAGIQHDIFPGVVNWLLGAKNEDHWSSTKATAAVTTMLMKEKGTVAGTSQVISSDINGKSLSVTDDLLGGNNTSFVMADKLQQVQLKKQAAGVATGDLMWYYFSSDDKQAGIGKEISLRKELSLYNNATGKWEPLTEDRLLHIADKIRVTLTITTSRALRYVYIDDKRAAAFESKENNSGYRYEDLNYYLSIRDEGMQFFSEWIPSGRSTISYEMIVAQEGDFRSGPAALQCMYKPEVNAYSNSMTIRTGK